MNRSLDDSSSSVEALYFPRAAQSDILRAAQKDELCLRALESSIREVIYGYLGSASLHRYGDAIRALATMAYYATSIGAGQRTLGEEYCDLLQVTSSRAEPSGASRALQVLLHTATPLVKARLETLQDSASPPASPTTSATNIAYGSAGEFRSTLRASALPSSPGLSSAFDSASDLAEVLMASNVMPVAADTLASPPDSRRSGQSHQATTPVLSPAPSSPLPRNGNGNGNGNGHSHSNGNGHSQPSSAPTSLQPAQDAAADQSGPDGHASAASILREWAASLLPACSVGLARSTSRTLTRAHRALCRAAASANIQQWLPIASQLHLALFYIFGLYFELPKRLTGIQYTHIGAATTPRRYFGAVGVLLLVQVLVNAQSLRRRGQPHDADQQKASRHLKVHPADHEAEDPQDAEPGTSRRETLAVGGAVAQPMPSRTQGQCPLCLADRVCPTALPCGHLLCWKCAVEWCLRKPMCPLCRLGATLQELVPLAHAVI